MTDIKYFLAQDTIDDADVKALTEWLLQKPTPRLTKDKLTVQFEQEWAKHVGTKYSVFVNSGSSANLLMVYASKLLLEKKQGFKTRQLKIVAPTIGWATTVAPGFQFGLETIMIGPDKKTFGIDLDQLEEVCKEQRPDIVIFVQVLGVPHYKDFLMKLKKKYGFILLEDACAALGAKYADGTKVGQVGDMSSFSFYFGHQLSTMEGGMINTDSKEIYDLLLMLRSHGWLKDLDKETYDQKIQEAGVDPFHKPFTFFIPGFNVRATDLQAFLGLRQVDKADRYFEKRNENHLRYGKNLAGLLDFQDWGSDYPVSISFGALAKDKEERTKIVTALVENGVETRIFSAGDLSKHPAFKDKCQVYSNEASRRVHSTGFFLPNGHHLSTDDIDFICDVVKKAIKE